MGQNRLTEPHPRFETKGMRLWNWIFTHTHEILYIFYPLKYCLLTMGDLVSKNTKKTNLHPNVQKLIREQLVGFF